MEAVMRQLKRKTTNPYSPDDRVRAWQSFGHATGTVRAGDVLRGDDPIVVEHHPWFEHVDTPTAERKNVWLEMPEPPQHTPEVAVQTIQIPPPRQVRCTVDVATSLAWSSGSPGAKSGTPPPFARTQLRQGQLLDVLDPIVHQHPTWFRWRERDVTPEDVERFEKLTRLEREGDQAVR
jgi:hypothetical protein